MNRRPHSVNILGSQYSIRYFDKPSDVDMFHRSSLWGQCDFWTRGIRIYDDGNLSDSDVFQTILHEVIHAIAEGLNLKWLGDWKDKDKHDELDLLALALVDTFTRNGWITFDSEEPA